MKASKAILIILLGTLIAPTTTVINHKFFRGIDGGLECATCTVLIGLIDQLAEVNNNTIVQAFDGFCNILPAKFTKPCQVVVEVFGPLIVDMVAEGANADDICRGLGVCYNNKNQPRCALYKKTLKFDEKKIYYHQARTRKHLQHMWGVKMSPLGWSVCDLPIFKIVCMAFNDVFYKQLPFFDEDQDLHSSYESLRGASWRGKDCDDTSKETYPGRRPELLNDVSFDSNCNGIWGFDNKTGRSYEEQFCKGTGQMGVVVLGDSVGAHFHAPQEWFDPQLLTKESLKDLPFALENELDWPQLSIVTGYMNSTWSVAKGPTDSLYSRLLKRNKCNHRNYQNIAVNGENSFEIGDLVETLRVNVKQDYPLLIVLELVGNDVCNGRPGNETVANMTKDSQMHDNLINLFNKLNGLVPPNSKVLIVGMADGDFIYKFLADRYHPFGRWRKDLKYPDVYDWWNCMQVTPCTGWLNRNATLRNETTQRANALSKVMSNLATTHRHFWTNLEINFVECPITTVIQKYLVEHGNNSGYQLIEPVDGFHPNQMGQALSAAQVWNYMELHLSHYLGPLNPHNDEITKQFGNQGGY